jgi:hypothetical protein
MSAPAKMAAALHTQAQAQTLRMEEFPSRKKMKTKPPNKTWKPIKKC